MTEISSLVTIALSLFNFKGLNDFPSQAKLTDNAQYDYVVVGGGTAGCVVAARLVENTNFTVLLLEAGDNPNALAMAPSLFFAEPGTSLDYNYRGTPDPYAARAQSNRTRITAGHGLGGTHNLNHLLYVSDVPETFREWEAITGDSSWNDENVLRAMKKSQTLKDKEIAESSPEYHGFDGPIGVSRLVSDSEAVKAFLKAQAEVGNPTVIDLNSNTRTGFSQPQYTIASPNEDKNDTVGGVRQTTSYSYLKHVKDYPNLYVSRNTVVKKINFEDNTAVSVDAIYNGKTYTFIAKKEVILSAGAFNSPQILQLSGVGPKEHLESKEIEVIADLAVGDNLRMPTAVAVVTKTKSQSWLINLKGLAPALIPTQLPFPVILGSTALNKSSNIPDAQSYNLIIPYNTPLLTIACTLVYGYKNEVCLNWQKEVKDRDSIMSIVANVNAVSTGSVRLISTDILDDPQITTGFYSNKEDLTNFIKILKDFVRFVSSPTYDAWDAEVVGVDFDECAHLEYDTDEFWECYILERSVSSFCYWGTCAMGQVVDGDLKVNGLNNLRVVDASVIPTRMHSAINAAVIAIAEIASEKIIAESGSTDGDA